MKSLKKGYNRTKSDMYRIVLKEPLHRSINDRFGETRGHISVLVLKI